MIEAKKERLKQDLTEKRERRTLYLEREKVMLTGGVQSYGIGSRNLARYNTDLAPNSCGNQGTNQRNRRTRGTD